MFSPGLSSKRIHKLVLSIAGAVILLTLAYMPAQAQRQRPSSDPDIDNQPAFKEFKGVTIGMPTDEARKKLGSPRDKSPEQDFYMFGDNQAVQVFYEKG